MGFFAIYGIITIFGNKLSINIFRGRAFAQAFCAASLVAFALEATVFNFPHYLKYFSDGEFYTTGISLSDSTIVLTSDGTLAELLFPSKDTTKDTTGKIKPAEDSLSTKSVPDKNGGAAVTALAEITYAKEGVGQDSAKDSTRRPTGVVFKNLDRMVTSIYIKPGFDSTADGKDIVVQWTDNVNKNAGFIKTVYRGLPFTNYMSFHPCGKVSELKIHFSGDAHEIAVNRQIPFYFSGLRLFAVACLFFAIIVFARKKLRAKAAYFLFEYKFDPSSKRQNWVYALSAVLLLVFSWLCASTSETRQSLEHEPYAQYNKYLVDALLAGRTNLEFGNPEKLLKAERPYDVAWLRDNGYENGVDWASDWVWYKGKFYCYFGVVPAVILYVPYKVFTGNYLSNHAGIFLFIAVAVVFLALLWRHVTKKYMPNARFAFYMLSFFALFFAGGLFGPLRFLKFYSIVSAAGFMFVVAGAYLLLKSVEREKTNLAALFFACLCFALAVGCRPNLLFASLMVPAFLWKRRSWQLLALVAVPYVMVAIPLCMYNYARFGSIFDFGFKYNMTNLNTAAHALMDPIGKAVRTFIAFMCYLFNVNTYSLTFPYVDCMPQDRWFKYPVMRFHDRICGMINFPIIVCLFYYVKALFSKRRPDTFLVSSTFLAIAAIIMFLDSFLVGISGRYMIDFAIFILIPSLFCAYHLCDEQVCGYRAIFRLKVVYVLLVFSIFVGLALFATTITNDATFGDPALYRYLQVSLGLPGTV
jgi:hypothetical protein